MKGLNLRAVAVAAGLLAGALTTGTPARAQQLTGAGATFPAPIYSKWFDAYHQKNPGVTVNYQPIGSGGGIQQLKNGTVDFGASDAPLSDEEKAGMPGPVVHIPTVAGAVALTYNIPGAPANLKLSGAIIADIFMGKLKKWDDPRLAALNPGVKLPGTAVAVAHRSDGSGTTYIFTHYLSAVDAEWKGKVGAGKSVNWPVGLGGKGSDGVSGLIKQTPGAIGYVELAYAVQNKLPYAQVQNKAGKFILPDVASTTAAAAGAVDAMKSDIRVPIVNSANPKAYPISGFTYILVYKDMKDGARAKALVGLLRWCIADGQKLAPGLLYSPLPKQVVALNSTALGTLTAGGAKIASGR